MLPFSLLLFPSPPLSVCLLVCVSLRLCVCGCVWVLVAVARFLVLLIKLSCQPAFYVRCLRIVVAHCVLVIVVAMICCYFSLSFCDVVVALPAIC